jgi:tripartite-type tricarboxylate transporter receptor subunit TctC
VSTPSRSAALPDLPTLAEAGVANYSFDAWIALIGPGGLPKPAVESSHAAVQAALALPEAKASMAAQGLTILDIGPDAAPAFFESELAKHQKLVRQSGATID